MVPPVRWVVGALVSALLYGIGAAPSFGAVVARVSAAGLELTSDGAGDETVMLTGTDVVHVASAQGVVAQTGCTGDGTSADCTLNADGSVTAELGGGRDTLDASTLTRAVFATLEDGGDTVRTGSGGDRIIVVGA